MKDRFKNWTIGLRSSQIYLALKANRLLVLLVSITMIAQTGLILVQPWPIRMMIDHVVTNPSHNQDITVQYDLLRFIVSAMKGLFYSKDFDFLYKGVGILLAIHLINSILLYFQNISLSRLGQQVVLHIRKNLFAQMMILPQSFFEKTQTGDLTSRISKDTADTQDVLESFITIFVRSVPTVIGILIISFAIDWIYALTFVLVIPVVYWANLILTRRIKEAMRQQRRTEGKMASNVQEAFYYRKAIATLSLESDIVDDFMERSHQSASYGLDAGRSQATLTSVLSLLVGITSLFVLFVGILRILHGCLTVGQLMVFLSYLSSLFSPIREISKFTGRIAKSAAALERIEEIARLNPMEIGAVELPGAVEAPSFRGNIEWTEVTFGYRPDQKVLQNFSLAVSSGQKVAFVGESGSGKSTILQLLMRLYDPQHGTISIDGVDIRSLKLPSLRNQMAVVLQDSYIFNMSIEENIAIGRPGATRQEIGEAAKAAEADDFIRMLPQGYETTLGEGGAGLSGGQKRRLAIARAFLRNAPVILLDEPTAGLDAASEQKVSEAVKRLSQGKTALIVSHQLATVADADLIVVLSAGRIVESGSHGELLEMGEVYKRLWETQQGEAQNP
ncbi:MAG: ABC transporter ATP-binding protein [Deltaproteobacteria bacterium]|nr:MAG: ABC transporter ATP-binding protein [Deltaproteobacteria bacterium]